MYIFLTFGKFSNIIVPSRLDLRNDLTSPWCMYGIIMSGMASSGIALIPIKLNTLGWSNFLAMLHSLMNSSMLDSKRSNSQSNKTHNYLVRLISTILFSVLIATSVTISLFLVYKPLYTTPNVPAVINSYITWLVTSYQHI